MPAKEIDKVLKVGLVQDGVLVEDTVLEGRKGVTVGLDANNTFAVSEPSAPKRHQLLEFTGQGYRLVMWDNMKGRLLIGDRTYELAELMRPGGKAKKTARGWEFDLEPRAKGKINIGRTTLLFQLVPPPLPPAAAKLPKELKSNVLKSIDYAFIILLAVSAFLHTGALLFIKSRPPVEDQPVVLDRFVQEITNDVIEVPEEATPEKAEAGRGGGGGGGKRAGGGNQGVENRGVLALLTREGAGGSVGDLLSDGLGSIDQALAGIGGVRVGQAGDSGGTRGGTGGGPGGGGGAGIGDIGSVGSGGTAGTGNRSEQKVRANMAASTGGIGGKIDAAGVRAAIRSRIGAIRQCYEMQLKLSPTLQGTVRISFTIGSSGDVAGCSVTSNTTGNSLVADCVCRRVARWRFPPPEEGTATVSQTFVFTPVD